MTVDTIEKRPLAKAPTAKEAAPRNVRKAARAGEDRRIVRSKRALRNALIELMEEEGFDSITVNELCARAGLNRGTFYNHFTDKDNLLATFEDDLIADLEDIQGRMAKLSLVELAWCVSRRRPLPLLVELFDYLRSQSSFLHAVMGDGGDVRFAPRLRDSVCTCLIQSILHEKYRADPTPFVEYYVAFFANAYLGIINRWVETGMQETSEEMALIAQRLLFIKPGESIEL